MTKLREIELTAGIVEVFKKSITDASDTFVLDYAKYADKNLLRGIRPNKQNMPEIKRRLASKIGTGREITKRQLVVLAEYRPLEFLEDFAIHTLDSELDNLCAVYGHDEVLASLLLDEREDVRELAESVVSGDREVEELTEEEKKDFAGKAVNFFKPFFKELLDLLNDAEEDRVDEEVTSASE
jgi:hypothetical protein